MGKHGLAIMIADKMPPPDKLKGRSGGDYGSDDSMGSGDDGGDEGEGGDDEEMELSTMADFRKCLKDGDDKSALGHLRDLVSMLSSPEEKDE